MSANTVVVRGVVTPNGTLELEGKPDLPVGPVEVVVCALPTPPVTEEGWWPCMQRIRAEREAGGYHFLNESEMQTHIDWLRDDEDRIDRIHREMEQERRREEGDLMRVYCDSVIFIYYLEGAAPFKARATAQLDALWAAGDVICMSDLVRLECRMHPIRLGDAAALAQYDTLFAQPNVERVPITTAVFDRATRIRAHFNFKTPDSLHLAAAVESGCDRFLTNDARLSAFTDIPVEVLP